MIITIVVAICVVMSLGILYMIIPRLNANKGDKDYEHIDLSCNKSQVLNAVSSAIDTTDSCYIAHFSSKYSIADIYEVFSQEFTTKVRHTKENYMHFEIQTSIMRYIDDVELLRDETTGCIHVKSCSRVGTSDLGLNRKRIEHVRELLLNNSQKI